jgi:hypothetical protein
MQQLRKAARSILRETEEYRIHWRTKTGATGHGAETFPIDEAQSICARQNQENKGSGLHHFPVKVEEPA